eukprot:827667-Amphidinium_carterae.1
MMVGRSPTPSMVQTQVSCMATWLSEAVVGLNVARYTEQMEHMSLMHQCAEQCYVAERSTVSVIANLHHQD